MSDVVPVSIGDSVRVVDENYNEHTALVTAVHGNFDTAYTPCINVVYVSGEEAKRDPFGRQLERMSSLQHLTQGPSQMPRPGRYWENV